jgi:DNA-binding transcriptional LysR family regulator
MNISIDQIEALDAVARLGTFQKAADELGKGHSAVIYLLKTLEEEVGLKLLDRSGYRSQMTEEAKILLQYFKRILNSRDDIELLCKKLRDSWEPNISLVYDGVIDFEIISDVLLILQKSEIPTEIKVSAAYLDEVEKRFTSEDSDLMLTILPNQQLKGPAINLRPIDMHLVAHKDHSMNKDEKILSVEDLNRHMYISVRGSIAGLGLSTEQLEFSSSIIVNDFHSKKSAIAKGLGFGWMPRYLIHRELESGQFTSVKTEISSEHSLLPRLYHRDRQLLGKGALEVLDAFANYS